MPYPNMPPEMAGKMDSCVQQVMAKGQDKESAIAICYRQLMGSEPPPEANLAEGAPPARAAYFAEAVDLRESDLDAAEYVARGVTLIRPGFSTNTDKQGRARYYSPAVLKQAAGVFEGTRAYADHPRLADQKELPERSVKDIVGYYENVRAGDGGELRGDFRVVGEAQKWLWPLIAETKRKPDLVELSINALGQTRLGEAEGRKAVVIESIVAANSVDVVTTGAAGGSFAGALLHSDPDGWTHDLLRAMPFQQWREARPDYVDQLKGEWKTVRETEAVKALKDENAQLKDQLQRLAEADRAGAGELAELRRAALADRLLAESALPYSTRAGIRAAVLSEADEAGMRKVVEREQAKYAAAPKAPVPVNGAGQRPAAPSAPVAAPPDPAAQLFGLNEAQRARPNETASEYAARRRQSS